MLYPRLKLAKYLLSEDGVIFISIDDNEVTNLIKICDEVFGESNFEADFTIKVRHEKRILRDDIRYQSCIEHIICYSRSQYVPDRLINERDKRDDYCWDIELLSSPDKTIYIGGYEVEVYSKDKWIATKKMHGEGQFKEYQIRGSLISQKGSASEFYELHLRELRSEDGAGTLYKVISMGEKGDGLGYRFIRQPYDLLMKNGFYYQGIPLSENSNKGLPYPNYFDFVVESNNVGEEGGVEYKGGKKPVALIEKIMEIAGLKNYKDSLVMDFFTGSATLAHAVMKLNVQYNYNLKYILDQLPENIDDTYKKASPKNKAALKNMIDFLDKINRPHFLTEIGEERIRRAGKKIKEENPLTTSELDIGFRVFRVDSTNMEDVYYRPADFKQEQLRLFADNIKSDRTPEDLLFQVMLDLGILLSSEIEETEIAGKKVFIVGEKYETLDGETKTHLIACFDSDVTENTVTEIAKLHPNYAVFRDSSMASDSVITNFEQIFETYSPKTQRKVL